MKHEKNHARTERAVHSIYAGLLVASAECLPLGILQIILAQRMGATSIMQTFSLITSWCQAAIKFSKLILLKDYLPYRSKQTRKIKDLKRIVNGAPPSARAVVLQEDHAGDQTRIGRAKERGIEMGAVRSGTSLMGVA